MTHGANINHLSPDDVVRWEQYLAKHPDVHGTNVLCTLILIQIQCKEISCFYDKGLPFYLKMKEVCMDG